MTPGSAVRHASVARHVTDCATRPGKVYDMKNFCYHCVSLMKLLSQEEQALMQLLEDTLRQQDKLKPPYGECHHFHDTEHWIGDCPEAKNFREQHMSTNKKPANGQCYICGLEDHWALNCLKREERRRVFSSQQSSVSTENQQTKSSVGQRNLQENERLLKQTFLILISVLREDALTLVK